MGWGIDGNRRKFKGKIRKQWEELLGEHLGTIAGKRNQLARRLQQRNQVNSEELSGH